MQLKNVAYFEKYNGEKYMLLKKMFVIFKKSWKNMLLERKHVAPFEKKC